MKQAKRTGKQLISLLLTLIMLVGILPTGLLTNDVIVSAGSYIPDAPTREQVSVIKFVDAKTNYLGGIALDAAGKVWTWGFNSHGMLGLGIGTGEYAGGMRRVPYFVDNNINIVQIEGGYHTNYALDDNGILYAWGKGNEGQMGNNTVTAVNLVPTVVTSLDGIFITKVFTTTEASSATYALAADGSIYAWGYSAGGRIPTSTAAYQRTAILQPGFDGIDVVDIALGYTHGLLLDSSGQVYAWGTNAYGQLGQGNTSTQANPVKVEFFSGMTVTSISAEFNSSMASTSDGNAYRWGTIYEATAASSVRTYDGSAGGPLSYNTAGRSRSANLPELIAFDLSSAPSFYSSAPPVAFVTAGRYASYLTDVYGRVWYMGWNVNYGFATDGPLFTTTNGGKHSVYVSNATLLRTLGDGDTQGYMNNVVGPVFSGVTSTSDFLAQYNSYARFGQWSQMGDGLHPTIYDKKYMVTTDSGLPTSHTYDYPLDALGRRLVYVIMRENGAYSGNFYVAADSYSGPWSHNITTANLPAGVTNETSIPVVKEDERAWIGLVVDIDNFDYTGSQLNELPYIANISTYQSAVLFIDNAGNLYKQSLDGSGSIAWGWDYGKYEIGTAGNNASRGLYNFYNYEITFMRGAPTVPASEISFSGPTTKIYLVEDANGNTPTDTVSVNITVPGAVTSTQLNLTVEPELTDLRYVFIPFDLNDSNFNRTEFNESAFNAAYSSGQYATGNLLGGQTFKNGSFAFDVEIPNNGKLWILGSDIAYTRVQTYTGIYYADNFYTPIEAMHQGVEFGGTGREVYAPTDENVVKTSADPANVKPDSSYIGIPVDVDGNVISNPTFGYDVVSISSYDALPGNLGVFWGFHTPQEAVVNYQLNDASFLVYDNGALAPFVHDFFYDSLYIPPIEIDDLEKTADPGLFTKNGDIINYAISFTMPDSLHGYESAKIVDVLPPAGLVYNNVATYIVDGQARFVAVEIEDNTISYELIGDEFTGVAGKVVTLVLEFTVDGWVSGNIENVAELYFKPIGDDYPEYPDAEDDEEIILAIGPPTEVEELPGDRKTALRWAAPLIGEPEYFEIKIDNFDWIRFHKDDLTFDDDINKWYILFETLPNGVSLENEVEYAFEIRAINAAGWIGPSYNISSTPDPLGDIGGRNTDLVEVYRIPVIPASGWPIGGGNSPADPYIASLGLPATFADPTVPVVIHRNFIAVGQDATFIMYDDAAFTNEVQMVDRLDNYFTWKTEVTFYLHVTSGNGQIEKYYAVTVFANEINWTGASIVGHSSTRSPLEIVPLNRSASMEVGNLLGSGGGLQLMPLSFDKNNPTARVIQLVLGETDYTIDARPGMAGTVKYLFNNADYVNFISDYLGEYLLIDVEAELTSNPYYVGAARCITDNNLTIIDGSFVLSLPVGSPDETLWAVFVENYPYNPTIQYYEITIKAPPTGPYIYMESLAGENTHPIDGAGTISDPFNTTIYLPLTKEYIENLETTGAAPGDIIKTGLQEEGRRFLHVDDTFVIGSGMTTTQLNLDEGENHVYVSIQSSTINFGAHFYYYDITTLRGLPFSKKADMLLYMPGDTLTYTIDFTLLKPIDAADDVMIVDSYDNSLVSFNVNTGINFFIANRGLANETLFIEGTHYSLNDTGGNITIAFLPTGIIELVNLGQGVRIELETEFTVLQTADDVITNEAQLIINNDIFGEDEVNVYPSDFEKTADPMFFIGNGNKIEYTLSFTLPADVSGYVGATILDNVPAGLVYDVDSATGNCLAELKINGQTQVVTLTTDIVNDTVSYYVDWSANNIVGGETIELVLNFIVAGWQSGDITNTAELTFTPVGGGPATPPVTAEETIFNIDDFSKNATQSSYAPGGVLDYTISWTLPNDVDVSRLTDLEIVDTYDDSMVNFDSLILSMIDPNTGVPTVLVPFDPSAPLAPADYTIDTTTATDKLVITFLKDQQTNELVTTLIPGAIIELKTVFNVEQQVTGDIENKAELFFNTKKAGEDFEIVPEGNVIKTASQSYYGPGDIITYTIEFTLPADVGTRTWIDLKDIYDPDTLQYVPNSEVVTIGSHTLGLGEYSTDDKPIDPQTGFKTFQVTIDLAQGHYNFTGYAGEVLTLTVDFEVSLTAAGTIVNTAEIWDNNGIGGRGREDINENLKKHAELNRYVPGVTDKLNYTITWTLPDDVDDITAIRIVDDYDQTKVSWDGTVVLSIIDPTTGAVTVLTATDYTVNNNTPQAGMLTVEFTPAGILKIDDEMVVELKLSFNVLPTATGDIVNNTEMFYNTNTKPDGRDTETVYETDMTKTASQSRYAPGDTITYTIDVTLPTGLENRTYIDIIDDYFQSIDLIDYVIGSADLTVDGLLLDEGTHYSLDNTTTPGVLKVTLNRDPLLTPYWDFGGMGGTKLILTVDFKVRADATGRIINNADISYGLTPGGGGTVIIDDVDFTKDADLKTYTPGGTIDYTVSWTLPTDTSNIVTLDVKDNFDNTKVAFKRVVSMYIGNTELVQGSGFTIGYTGTNSVTITVTAAGLTQAQNSPNEKVILKVEFDVLPTATGLIRNDAELHYTTTGIPDGEDFEEVEQDDFQKTVAQSRYVPGETLDYKISVTIPDDIDKIDKIEIFDTFTATQLENGRIADFYLATSTSLPKPLDQSEYDYDDSSAGLFLVTIDRNVAGHINLDQYAGWELILELRFDVATAATGSIINDAELRYDDKLSGGTTVTIDESDFSKDAVQNAYTPGGTLDYSVSWTLPDDVDKFNNIGGYIRIVDDYDQTKVTYDSVVSLTVKSTGGATTTLVLNTDYSIVNDAVAGVLTVEINANGLAKLSVGAEVEISVKFNVLPSAYGDIENKAQLFYGQNKVGEDDETVTQGGYNPASAVIEAKKVVTGAGAPALSAGQFEFILRDSADTEIERRTNDLNGNIKFSTITSLTAPGTYTYTVREVPVGGNWVYDNSVHTIEVIVIASGANLVATVNYPGPTGTTTNPPPTFTNAYRTGGGTTPGTPSTPPTIIEDEGPPIGFIEDHVAYMIGYPDDTVRPDRNITRAEVATVFFRLLDQPTRTRNWTQINYFTDVRSDVWYNNAVSTMSAMRIVNGYPDGTFRPDGSITRGELAAIAARFARQQFRDPIAEGVEFTDITGHWAENDIRYAAALGWVNGYPDGSFRPNQPITRAEYATLVNRMLERVPETIDDLLPDEMKNWVDNANKTAWYYIAIQEASNSHEAEYKIEKLVPGQDFEYEFWTELIPNWDWAEMEKTWSNSSSGEPPIRERPEPEE
ncbi:MAG: isopeptide-forming domain-containing fimbrial protein [Oscillospiraceae bacterium]|nr:isopeptide-forming domain-containing fimbrial protein [Oscillospiraceae bacterium]